MSNSSPLQSKIKDDYKEVIAAIVMGVVGISTFLGIPVIVGTLTDGYGLSETQAGYHVAMNMVGGIIASILVSLLISRINRRVLLFVGLMTGALFNVLMATAQDQTYLFIFSLLAGFGGGIVYAVGIALLAGTHHTGKNFSILLFSQGAFSGIELYFIPKIAVAFSAEAIFVTLGVGYVLVLPLVHFISKRYQADEKIQDEKSLGVNSLIEDKQGNKNNALAWLCLTSIFFFYLAVGSFWTYVERLGVSANLSSELISNYLTIGEFLALVGCIAAYWLSERVGQPKPLLFALFSLSASFALLSTGLNQQIYLLGILSFFLLWNFIDIFQLGTLSEIGHSGRYVSLAPASQAFGTAIGPALSGWLLSYGWSLSELMILNSLSVVIALFAFIFVYFSFFKRKNKIVSLA